MYSSSFITFLLDLNSTSYPVLGLIFLRNSDNNSPIFFVSGHSISLSLILSSTLPKRLL